MDPSRYGSPASQSVSTEPTGFYRGVVKAVDGDTVTVQVPRLFGGAQIPDVPVAGPGLSVDDPVFVSFIEGRRGALLAFAAAGAAAVGDITSVTAGTNLNGGGTSGAVTVNLESDITLDSVTATDVYANLFGPVHIEVKNTSGGTLAKGAAVYATGSVGASGAVEVQASDADNAATMPALGLLDEQLANNAVGSATVLGVIEQVDTSAYSINDELYVSTTPGALTDTRPTGASELVQKIGRVVRVHASTGEILVLGAGRTNDVPNGTLSNDISGNAATAGSAPAGTLTGSTLNSGVTASSLTSVGTLTSLTVSGSATSDSYRWGGTSYLTSTTTSALESELLARDVFDSSFSAFKTGWSYAGNGNLTDAGRLTELAGTSWLTWTDNSADNTLGNYTALVIAPNTGGSGGGVFVYNDQGSSYSPGWRELWNSSRTIVGPDGSAGAPAYSFADDTNTGMYSDGSDSISFATGGTQRLDVDGGGIKGKVSFSAPLGSASAPGFNFDGDTDTGMYRHASNTLGVTAGGTQAARFTSNGIRVPNGSAATPSYTFINDSNTGFYITGNSGVIYWSGNNNTGGYLWNTGIRTDNGSESTPAYSFTGDTDTGMYRNSANSLALTAGGNASVVITSTSFSTDLGVGIYSWPGTGTGNDAEWVATGFGNYYLVRNSSLRAEKENIQDPGTELTASMIDQVEPKLWNRIHAPGVPEIGPIAEDMDAISPYLAAHGFDEDGNTFLTGFNKTGWMSLMTLAIKDLRSQVADLTTRLEALEAG